MVEGQRLQKTVSITSAESVSDLGVMLYMGAAQVRVENEAVVNSNKQMVQAMSQPIALVNKEFFKTKLREKLDPELQEYIQQVNTRKGEKSIVDSYGRVTYYYAVLGNKKIPVYQPGTIMFECGVVNDSELAVEAHGSQQNGAILGNGCAIFLCKFIARLIQCYNENAQEAGIDPTGELDQDTYKQSLTRILHACCFEDVSEHGRLLSLKEILASLTQENQLDESQLACLYAKDLSVVRGTSCEEETVQDIINNVPSQVEIKEVISNRHANSKFKNDQMFRKGDTEIADELESIRDSLLSKDGIVPSEKQDLFREQLQRTFSNDLIRAVSKAPQRSISIKKLNNSESGVTIGGEDEDLSTQDEEDEDISDTGSVVEEQKEEEDDNDEDDEEAGGDVDQAEVNRTWIKGLDVNYPLKTYYKHLKTNLQILLGSQRIPTKEYPQWSENLYKTFVKLTQVVPEILFVYQNLGLDEANIMQSASALQDGLTQAQKYKLASYISQHLVIVQRQFIPSELKKEAFVGLDLDRIKSIFDSTNLFEVRADLDAFLLLAQIAQENNPAMLQMADPEKGSAGVYELGDHLIGLFESELRQKRYQAFISDPIAPGELPEQVMNSTKLILVPQYFTRNETGFRLPRIMKRIRTESDVIYETRIKNYLLNMDDNQFSRVAELVEPEDPIQFAFFELYNEISAERVSKPESNSKCTIF